MRYVDFDAAESLVEQSDFTKSYYYIAHLLDRVLLGQEKDDKYDALKQALRDGQVLELHLFNEEKEIFATRADGRYLVYHPLLHKKEYTEQPVITRCYELMRGLLKANGMENCRLEMKEYIDYDEESHLAYVKKTILHRFKEE
jgi:hypothetical protein